MNENTQQTTNSTPEEAGGRTFTQEEVNKIVSDRLARERAKAEPSPEETREADLKARGARLDCREYISAEGFPEALLELFDTKDAEKFKAAIQRLDEIVQLPSKNRRIPRIVAPFGHGGAPTDAAAAALQAAFSPPKI